MIRLLAAVFVTGIVAIPLMTSPLQWYVAFPLAYTWVWATVTAYRRRWGHRWPNYGAGWRDILRPSKQLGAPRPEDFPAVTYLIVGGFGITAILYVLFEYVIWASWD
ncbi:MAG: hypothetical protein OXH97_10945 [Chloroflexota bacterium]|nr:hypothetical protein [Chloroflexota bacterium]